MTPKSAVSAIEKNGILLVYPIDNRKEPPSLWSSFFPRSQMRWEWDQNGDTRVSDLWRLREELSSSNKVVYAKWYRGRATFFSKEVFVVLLSLLGSSRVKNQSLAPESKRILDLLVLDSPLSTKQIKQLADLRGRVMESIYTKALKELWNKLLIVGYGEIEDGAFPSLAIGSAQVLFEELWEKSKTIDGKDSLAFLTKKLPHDSLFLKYLFKINSNTELNQSAA